MLCLIAQSCLTVCDPMDCSPPGSSVKGILQARILEWVAMPSSRRSPQLRYRTEVSHITAWFFIVWATREAQEYWIGYTVPSVVELPDPGIQPESPALQMDSLPVELPRKPNNWYKYRELDEELGIRNRKMIRRLLPPGQIFQA